MNSAALRAPSLEYAKDFYYLSEVFAYGSISGPAASLRVRALLELGFDPVSIAFGISGAMKFPQTTGTYQNLQTAAIYLAEQSPENANQIGAIIAVGATVPDGMIDLPLAMTGAQYLQSRGAIGWESDRSQFDYGIFVTLDNSLISYDPPHGDPLPPEDGANEIGRLWPIVCADGRTFPGEIAYPGGTPCFDESAEPIKLPWTRRTCPDGVTTYDSEANYLVDPCAQRTPPAPIDPADRQPKSKSAVPLLLAIGAVVYLAAR